MLSVKIEKWNTLKEKINNLYIDNRFLTIYQSWDYLNSTGKGFTARHPMNMLGLKEKNYTLYNDDQLIAVAPLLIKRRHGKNFIYLRGTFTGAGNLDFIYSDTISFDDFSFFIDTISKMEVSAAWKIERISEKSLLCNYWKQYIAEKKGIISSDICVEIPVPSKYDDWYAGLSKSTRQNIRTAYNRLKTDNKKLNVELYYDTKIPKKIFNEILKVSSMRALEYMKIKSKMLWSIINILKKREPVMSFLRKYTHCFYGIVRIDGKISAFLAGFEVNDGRIIIPKLSYNSAFYRYSPGTVLINETMNNICTKDDILSLDLSRGDEKYKSTFGGIEYLNYSFEFNGNSDY